MNRMNLMFAVLVCGFLSLSVVAQVGKKGDPSKPNAPTTSKTTTTKKSSTSNRSSNSRQSNRTNSKAVEIAFWDSIKTSTNPDDFKAYLNKYPNGEFTDLARNKVSSLETEAREKERQKKEDERGAEITYWDSIKNSNNPEDFRAYLRDYPNGNFASLARNKLDALEAAAREKQERIEKANRALTQQLIEPMRVLRDIFLNQGVVTMSNCCATFKTRHTDLRFNGCKVELEQEGFNVKRPDDIGNSIYEFDLSNVDTSKIEITPQTPAWGVGVIAAKGKEFYQTNKKDKSRWPVTSGWYLTVSTEANAKRATQALLEAVNICRNQ